MNPVDVVPVPFTIPRLIGSPVAKLARAASALDGRVIVSAMFEPLVTVMLRLASEAIAPPSSPVPTIPTLVAVVGSEPPTNPEPVRTRLYLAPATPGGTVAGEILVSVDPERSQ